MSNGKQRRKNKKNQEANDKEKRAKKRELLHCNSKKLIKICKEYNVKYNKNRRNEIVNKLLDKMFTRKNKVNKSKKKRKNKVKKLSLTFSSNDLKEFKQEETKQYQAMLLRQSSTTEFINTDLIPLSENTNNDNLYTDLLANCSPTPITDKSAIINQEINKNKSENDFVTEEQILIPKNSNNRKHEKRKSIIDIIACAPKMNYDINDLHGFDTVKDIKDALPVALKSTQCKLFHNGQELDDNKTLTQLNITNGSEIKVLISWREFKPDPNAAHPRDMEHRHYDKVAELKRLNDFNILSKLIIGIQRECNKNNDFIIMGNNEQSVLYEYCMCLSGNRTYDRIWTNLHSLCYDYQNNIEMVVDLLREHNIDNDNDQKEEDDNDNGTLSNPGDLAILKSVESSTELIKENLYIDAWPHNGYDTPLKIAIQRANPKELPETDEERKLNEINAIAAIELVEFLVLQGARRRIGLILTNLERKGNDDHTYPFMDDDIREKLIEILKPYEEEDPWKPERKLTV